MPETDEVITRVRMDTDDFEAGAKRVDASLSRVGRGGGNLVRNLIMIRGALGATETMMNKFGKSSAQTAAIMDTVNTVLSVSIGILAIYRAGLALTKVMHWLTAKAAAAQAMAASAAAHPWLLGAGAAIAAAAILGAWGLSEAFAPKAQFGMIVPPRPGGTLVRVAEAGRTEAVVPMGGMDGGGNISVTMNVQTNDPDELVRVLGRRIQQLRTAGY